MIGDIEIIPIYNAGKGFTWLSTCGDVDSSVNFLLKIFPICVRAATSIDSLGVNFSLKRAKNLSTGEEFSLNPVAHQISESESLHALDISDLDPRSHLTISSLLDAGGRVFFAFSRSRTNALTT